MKKKLLFLSFFVVGLISYLSAQSALWADSYGGNQTDQSNSVVTDAVGNVYITGTFESATLTIGAITLTNTGGKDMFVAKFDPSGNPIWANNSSGPGNEYGNDIAVDVTGNVYVIGSFDGGNVNFGSLPSIVNSGGSDFYVVKYNSMGIPQWAITNLAGFFAYRDEFGNGIAVDASNIYVIGSFNSSTFLVNGQIIQNSTTSSTPPFDIFVLKLNSLTGVATWSDVPLGMPTAGTTIDDDDFGTDIDVSSSGDIFITGYFKSVGLSFAGLTPLINSGPAGTIDIFAAKYFSSGAPAWSVNPTGSGNDFSYAITVDASGDVYITGNFDSPLLSLGGISVSNSGTLFSDYFIAKCSPSSSSFIWAKSADANFYPQWNFDDVGKDLALDNCGHIYVTGWYNSNVINFGTGYISNATNNNYSEIFVAKYGTLSGNILNLFQGHEVYNDQGMGVAINDCECPVVTGWFNNKLNLSGSFLSHDTPTGTSDFYVGKICDYDSLCEIPCENPIVLNTGESIPIGFMDGNWTIMSWPPGISPTGVIACPWSGSGPPAWSYGAPIAGTQWISVFDSTYPTPQAPLGIYKFRRTFTLDPSTCINPELNLCVMVDDTADIYLNGNYLGSAISLNVPTLINTSGYGIFVSGLNTLDVHVKNSIKNKMAFDIKGSVCCNEPPVDPCDSLWVAYQQTSNCCEDVYLTNSSSNITIDNIQFSTASGSATLTPGTPPASWTVDPNSGYPVNSFMVLPNTSGSFSGIINLCVTPDPSNNPQQINITWMGFDTNNDTIWCYDTLDIYCPVDTLSCDSCENIRETIKTGVAPPVWTLLSAPSGITTGVPATSVPVIPTGWRAPFTGSNWISYNATGGGWGPTTSAPLGTYHYQTQFCVCDTCAENEKMSLHYCILVDDTADIFLNGSQHLGTATSQSIPFSSVYNGPFNIGINTLDVYVINNPEYFTGFDFEGWICCDDNIGISENKLIRKINIYPNPVSDYLFIKSLVYVESIDMYSNIGQLIKNIGVYGFENKLSVNNLKPGLYYMRIKTKEGVISKKIVIY